MNNHEYKPGDVIYYWDFDCRELAYMRDPISLFTVVSANEHHIIVEKVKINPGRVEHLFFNVDDDRVCKSINDYHAKYDEHKKRLAPIMEEEHIKAFNDFNELKEDHCYHEFTPTIIFFVLTVLLALSAFIFYAFA